MRQLKKRFKKLKMIQANTIELWDISTESQKKPPLCVKGENGNRGGNEIEQISVT